MNRVLNRTKFDNNLPACVEQVDKKKKKTRFRVTEWIFTFTDR